MTTALAERTIEAVPVVTTDQLELIKRTVAKDATTDELKLYLYDCQRQGVHPLDKLVHFTKRSGKYTPVTSIDFMRTRAADTGEYAGSDDATFAMLNVRENEPPLSATVTVWRLVQGQRCSFTATARWSEYKPESNDFMWKKMPHTMLAKCAEALALRKGFPRQLAGLYAKEEMDQADKCGYVVEAPTGRLEAGPVAAVNSGPPSRPSVPNGGDSGAHSAASSNGKTPAFEAVDAGSIPAVAANGLLYVERLEVIPTKNANIRKVAVILSDGRQVTTIKDQLAAIAEQCCQDRAAVTVETKTTKWGEDLVALHRVLPEIDINADLDAHREPVDEDSIPF